MDEFPKTVEKKNVRNLVTSIVELLSHLFMLH